MAAGVCGDFDFGSHGNSLHDNDSLFGGGLHVNVIHAGPGSPDDFQVEGGVDDVGRDLRC